MRCISCHRQGGSAFDLSNYEQVRPWAEAIKEEVLERRMPPWGALKGFGEFRDDGSLTEEEITIVSGWVAGGSPKGDSSLLPEMPRTHQKPDPDLRASQALRVSGNVIVKHEVIVAAIRPETIPEGASIRLIAENPDGSVEPMIWLYKYAPRFARIYEFRVPMRFRAGTRFRMEPAIGSVSLLLTQR